MGRLDAASKEILKAANDAGLDEEGTHDALMAMRGIYAKYNSRYN